MRGYATFRSGSYEPFRDRQSTVWFLSTELLTFYTKTQ